MEKMILEECLSLYKDMEKLKATDDTKVWTEEELPTGLVRERMPKHVGVVMDGNRRWAKKHGWVSMLSPDGPSGKMLLLVELCCKWGIQVLTLFAFSTQNWVRPQHQVDIFMEAGEIFCVSVTRVLMRNNVRLSLIGDPLKLPISLQQLLTDTTDATKNNTGLHLIVALNYGGQEDIVRACTSISRKVKDNLIEPEDIDVKLLSQELDTKCTELPNPDLIIRTGGELRISNFLLWQLAYSELYFEDCLWPDFGEKEFVKALYSFQERRRRYGGDDEEG
ncbi:hypothetical protein MKX03_014193 [Papaver bracteatum]|nr:hypothetical protein MKX03_014193 [Papaver bracteatum]